VRRKPSWVRAAVGIAIAIGSVVAAYAVLHEDPDDDEPTAPAGPGIAVCGGGKTTRGIDVSYYQETIRWSKVRRAGVMFAFIRVSDGTSLADPLFRTNWSGAKQAGVLRGAYQYFRPDTDPIEQADLLIEALQVDPGELPPVIDVETDGGLTATEIARRVRQWVDRVHEKLEIDPIVYTGPDFWRDRVNGADFRQLPLWIAHYTTGCPTVPPRWTSWTFWQHTDTGRVNGIEGPVDLDVFAGDYQQLLDFARRARPLL
jgi:lysozyme